MKILLKKGGTEELSRHLKQANDGLDCRCKREDCTETVIDTAAVALFELVRDVAQGPVSITCWYRCPAHNKEVGGASGSAHPDGAAFDCSPVGRQWTDTEAATIRFKMKGYGGLGIYRRGGKIAWLHVDSAAERNWTIQVK